VVYFVAGVMRDGQRIDPAAGGAGATPALMTSHSSASAPAAGVVDPIAPPAGGLAIADVWARRNALAGKQVTLSGKVVKVNNQIMGRNWIHLQDGSGSTTDRTNDLTITTADSASLGDVITVTGVLGIDRDFGAGYAYGAIVENAKILK
jgi:hypothetical protein